jgi:hypothetical protein
MIATYSARKQNEAPSLPLAGRGDHAQRGGWGSRYGGRWATGLAALESSPRTRAFPGESRDPSPRAVWARRSEQARTEVGRCCRGHCVRCCGFAMGPGFRRGSGEGGTRTCMCVLAVRLASEASSPSVPCVPPDLPLVSEGWRAPGLCQAGSPHFGGTVRAPAAVVDRRRAASVRSRLAPPQAMEGAPSPASPARP